MSVYVEKIEDWHVTLQHGTTPQCKLNLYFSQEGDPCIYPEEGSNYTWVTEELLKELIVQIKLQET